MSENISIKRRVLISIVDKRETLRVSVVRDACTYAGLVASVATGWYLDSQALQWTGAALFLVALVSVASRGGRRDMTIEEARDRLDQLERQ